MSFFPFGLTLNPFLCTFSCFLSFFLHKSLLLFSTHLNLAWCWEGLSWSPAWRELVDREASSIGGTWGIWKEYRLHVLYVHTHTHTHTHAIYLTEANFNIHSLWLQDDKCSVTVEMAIANTVVKWEQSLIGATVNKMSKNHNAFIHLITTFTSFCEQTWVCEDVPLSSESHLSGLLFKSILETSEIVIFKWNPADVNLSLLFNP